MNNLLLALLLSAVVIIIDYYVFRGLQTVLKSKWKCIRYGLSVFYWCFTFAVITGIVLYNLSLDTLLSKHTQTFIGVGIFMNYVFKGFLVFFFLLDDVIRFIKSGQQRLREQVSNRVISKKKHLPGKPIPRSKFLAKTGIVMASVPVMGMSYGILSGAHDYTIRRKTVFLPNLPSSFDGIRIAQLSDIHSGSFFNKKAVVGGVEMLQNERPDIVFFTGDLVNDRADELKEYINIFDKVQAPLGVYSVLGNHDYGEYVKWPNGAARKKNVQDLIQSHKNMGWDILINEHRFIEQGGDKLAIIGVENWGVKADFPQYGKLAEASQGTEEAAVKLLLSHDPSHWDAQVRPEFSDIDIMYAGHTHGMQFGVEIPGFKWSPVEYVYEQWAGLYQKENQYLYVNRGFGYLGGFPGRVGMPPEITIMELKKA